MTKENNSTLKKINISNKRGFEEEYTEYRLRLKKNYYTVKYYLRGELFWDSLSKGTYRR
tara:strand:- start:662 stop:838 length:177 start_codon:yes stop_codon:yes gene_type:complete